MTNSSQNHKEDFQYEEIKAQSSSGITALLLNLFLLALSLVCFILGIININVFLIVVGALYFFIIGPILFAGLKILKPNEAIVLTLFGKYYGTLRGEGFFFVNPFVTAVNPASPTTTTGEISLSTNPVPTKEGR